MFFCPWDSPGKNTRVGCHALLQGIFLIQGLNPYLLGLLRWLAGSLPLVSPGKPRCKIVLFFQNIVYLGYMWCQETESIQFRLKVWFVLMTLIPRRNNAQLSLRKVVKLTRCKDPTDRTLWLPFAHYHCYHSDTNSLIHFAEFKFLERARESSDCFSLRQVCTSQSRLMW